MTRKLMHVLAAAVLMIAAPIGTLYAATHADGGGTTDCATSTDPRCKDTLTG